MVYVPSWIRSRTFRLLDRTLSHGYLEVDGIGIVGLGVVAPGYCWFLADVVRSTGGVCGRFNFYLRGLVLGSYAALCKAFLQNVMQVAASGRSCTTAELFIHSTCTEL